jgi:hypothetical protein
MSDELTTDNWDPAPTEREWFSHRHSGDRGYKVRRNGQEHIKLDRPAEDITQPFKAHVWEPDQEYRPMTAAQVAQVAFAADKALCFFLGKHEAARREWASLSDKQKQFWMLKGPQDVQRRELYAGVFASLRAFFR